MVIELVTFKLEREFLAKVDETARQSGFSSRTDFIRNALREKVDELKLREAMVRLSRFRGISKTHTTDEEIHKAGEKVFWELAKKKGFI